MSTPVPVVYWHRTLPPLDAEVMDEHVVEAQSPRVSGMIERHGALWDECHRALIASVESRIAQELTRLDGDYAHVIDEHVDSRRDDITLESWLHARVSYVMYRRAGQSAPGRE